MAHYALLDDNNIVIEVIVGQDEDTGIEDWEKEYERLFKKKCRRTSYNMFAGEHLEGKEPFRKNYAIIGGTYDEDLDAFIPPKPYDSWILDTESCIWYAPVPEPIDDAYIYGWDEDLQEWYPAKERPV